MNRSIASLSTSVSAIATFAPHARSPTPPSKLAGNSGRGSRRVHAIIAPDRSSGTSRHAKASDTLHAAGNAERPSTTQTSAKGTPARKSTDVACHAARRSRTSDPTQSSAPPDANKRRNRLRYRLARHRHQPQTARQPQRGRGRFPD